MEKQYTYEELVQLRQENKITSVQFLMMGDNAEDYRQWCEDHGEEPTEDNAQLYLEHIDTAIADGQDADGDAE